MKEQQFKELISKLDEINGKLNVINMNMCNLIPTTPEKVINCICNEHTSGESSGGWYCPVHGWRY